MSKLDERAIEALRTAINAALASLAIEKGMTLQLGPCKFDSANGNFTFRLEGRVKGGLTKEEANYEALRRLRPKLPALRYTFALDGRTFVIAGANSTLTKVIASSKGKAYNVAINAVEQAAAKNAKD